MSWKIGVDIGGTFIDFCALEQKTQRLVTLKVLTTPDDPGRELLAGIDRLAEREGIAPEAVDTFVHGTTVGINTVIQRKGARLAMITNRGFEDVVELARLRLPDMYSLFCSQPDPLISRDMIFGISGRMLADGGEGAPIDLSELPAIVEAARAKGAEGFVVALLHSYVAPAHERAVRSELRRLAPDLFAFASCDVWPVIREYERSVTTILNGYVHPRVARYVDGLEAALATRKVPARPLLTKSNGGLMNAAEGKTACVNMLLSGTASGVIGAAYLARQAGIKNVLTLDIGGTSADLALIIDGEPQFGTGEPVGEFPLYIPSVSVSSIGIGGGSIAQVDEFGVLKVGPQSAGSVPGPACYGRGGQDATITDAMAVLGHIGQLPMAYGQLTVDRERANAAVGLLAQRLGKSLEDTAESILRIAVSEMFVEVEKLVSRHGVDLADFTLMPFGGGGPMLGCFLAKEIGVSRIVAPRRPGVVSALGGLVADLKGDFIRTVLCPCDDEALAGLRGHLHDLTAEGEAWLRDGQGFEGSIRTVLSADMRYAGQSFEIEVALERDWIVRGDIAAIRRAYHHRHLSVYDFDDPAGAIEVVNLRLVAIGEGDRVSFAAVPQIPNVPEPALSVEIHLDGAARPVPLYRREALDAGACFSGPAIVAQEDTTLAIPFGFAAHVDGFLNIHLEVQEPTE
ncbi:hydantoinase/oxoprolinase family protein [Jiella sp. MQZ9-1]|uniref:Hydantoinase/oxoprolinase family protein n=1 Tax=Jiella flava TaxID=2816857 RepID=A0A939G031_9HYPH|nr:hydantoinase/oxoprolinase family protein [Jiella flava]MBO0662564.1 hydantoinase/oxoprolinase family protein [Jiella flava]MCD2472935.1 hydantoinase/oxoprolinase family protein [Jiella flava]